MSFRVLVVDTPANAQMLRGMLLTIGASDVVLTDNSEAGLSLMQSEHFDAVFCDEAAQPLNPAAFAKKLRRDPSTTNPEIPLILITAAARARHAELARDSGANDLILRPISVKTLKRKIKAALPAREASVDANDFRGPDRRRGVDRRAPGAGQPDPVFGERRGNSSRRARENPEGDA